MLTFERADIVDLAVPDLRFDMVMGHSILHLLRRKHRDAVLANVHRALKPGGLFISSTICIGEFSAALRVIPPIMRVLPFLPPVQGFTREDLRRAIAGAGFTIEHDWAPNEKAALFLIARKAGGQQPQAISIK